MITATLSYSKFEYIQLRNLASLMRIVYQMLPQSHFIGFNDIKYKKISYGVGDHSVYVIQLYTSISYSLKNWTSTVYACRTCAQVL